MQLADRIFIIAKGVLFVRIIDRSLLLNHSPSEWFSVYKNARRHPYKVPPGAYLLRASQSALEILIAEGNRFVNRTVRTAGKDGRQRHTVEGVVLAGGVDGHIAEH